MAKKKKLVLDTTPSTIEEFREGSVVEETLPSGMVVRLKRVGILDLVVAGKIPDNLTAIAEKAINDETLEKLSIAEIKSYTELVDLIVCASVISPKLYDDTAVNGSQVNIPPDSLGVSEIEFPDKIHIYNWANGVVQGVARFRRR